MNEPIKEKTVSEVKSCAYDTQLKVLRGWNEIVEKAAANDGSILGFLRTAKAFVDVSGKIYIRFPNEFAKSMVEKPNIKESLRAAMCMVLQRNVVNEDISFGTFVGDEDKFSDLDEFNID